MQQSTTTPPPHDDQAFAKLQEWFEQRMGELNVPGAALGVIHGHQIHRVALGVTNIQTQEPVTLATAFRVASLTKVLTAAGIVGLVGEGNRALKAPISAWYPDFQVADEGATASATMQHLLSHSAGWADAPWPEGDVTSITLDDVIGDLVSAEQLAAPGTLFNYSNSSFLLAGHILATTTGTSYETAITERILQPLRMESSGFTQDQFSGLTVASGHTEGEAGLEPNDPWEIVPAFNPAGGLLSTVDDMLRFVGFFAGTSRSDNPPLTADQRQVMQQAQGPGGSLGPTIADSMGLGWMLAAAADHQVAMSFGSDSGIAAGMAVVADQQFGLVILANSDPGLQLATETVSKALELYLQAPLPSVQQIALTPDERAALIGTFAIPGDLSFDITVQDTEVIMTGKAGGEIVPPLTGPVTMLTPTVGQFMVGNMPVLIDFIHHADGNVGWIRSFARLAPRVR